MGDEVTIRVSGVTAHGHHGVYVSERERGQAFTVDIEIVLAEIPAGDTDRLGDTIDYSRIARIATEAIEGPPVSLLEHLASMIADRLFEDERVTRVAVTITKPELELEGGARAAVTLRRSR